MARSVWMPSAIVLLVEYTVAHMFPEPDGASCRVVYAVCSPYTVFISCGPFMGWANCM